jgi:hypothetical protein
VAYGPEDKETSFLERRGMGFFLEWDRSVTKESIIDQTYSSQISPNPSFPKREIPPFCKGREGGI